MELWINRVRGNPNILEGEIEYLKIKKENLK